MKWIKVACDMDQDPSVIAIADVACKGDVSRALGCIVRVLMRLPAHARDGDVSALSDSALEAWAGFDGKPRGAFAKAFRAHLCRDGVVRGWQKHNGEAIETSDRKREQARERMRRMRARGRETGDEGDAPVTPPPPDVTPHVTRPVTRNIGERSRHDGTGVTTTTPPTAAAVVPPRHRGGGQRTDETGADPVAALPWPDPESARCAAVLVAERGADATAFAAACVGWAETGLGADGLRPVGWPAVAKAVRDYAGVAGKAWRGRSFDGFVRTAATTAPSQPAPPVAGTAPVDGPRSRCAALLAADGWRAPVASWAEALGVDVSEAARVLGAVVPLAADAPVAMAVELLIAECNRVAVGAAA